MNPAVFSVWDWIMLVLTAIGIVLVIAMPTVQAGVAIYKWWEGRKK